MKRIILMMSVGVSLVTITARAQDSPMTQRPIISSSQDSASSGTQWPAKGQDSMQRPIKKGMDSSQASSNNRRYYYYPSRNIYYNDATHDYMYYDSTSTKWSSAKQLPSNMQLDKNAERYPFSYTGTEPWNDNSSHKMKYKIKKDGSIKIKEKD